jgi:hypothetical protein
MEPNRVAANRRLIVYLLMSVGAAALFVNVAGALSASWGGDGGGSESSPAAARGDEPRVERVLIISVDGLRPDLLLRAPSPNIRSLMDRGSYSMWARTTEMSITLPSHTSMLTGVRPEYHKIFWNHHIEHVYPDVPTIFELARKVKVPGGSGDERLSTGLVGAKTKFHGLARPGSVDYVDVYKDKEGDNLTVGQSAADMIRRHAPRVMFVHLADVDNKGHAIGWSTPEQMAAIDTADAAVGLILDAVSQRGFMRNTLIILSADHGGQGKSHGPNDVRSRHIPWIVVGPGIRRNYDLTRHDKLVVNTEDTFAVACTLMGIPMPAHRDGKMVEEIREPRPSTPEQADKEKKEKEKKEKELKPFETWWEPPGYKWEPTPMPSHH